MTDAHPTTLLGERETSRRWPLLVLCALFALWAVANFANYAGIAGHAPWWGWWDVDYFPTAQPYIVKFDPPQPDGAAARAGIRGGDWLDLREQSLAARVRLYAQPVAGAPIALVLHRGMRQFAVRVIPSTSAEGNVALKAWSLGLGLLSSAWFIACALLIALRRAALSEARLLILILLGDSLVGIAGLGLALVTPSFAISALLFAMPQICALIAMFLLVRLSTQFGTRTGLRKNLEACAYSAIVLNTIGIGLFFYGLLTLRIDPLEIGSGNFATGIGMTAVLKIVAAVAVLLAIIAAVRGTPLPERARAAWLLLPLAITWAAAVTTYGLFTNFAHTWAEFQGLVVLSSAFSVAGAFAVTYAVLKRRVVDLEFVLSRTIVVAAISFIVVASFVLLEWLLGSFVSDVSHTTGVIANAALALALGLSLRYVHNRVDAFVDRAFFRKRHEDERVLRDFSQEAAYLTHENALLDRAIAKIQRHTDACSAAVLLDGSGHYQAVRSFGIAPASVDENDEAIVSLRTWHKPLDPHHYETTLSGALALPMLARGRLHGVVLLGERIGGEAYTPGEVDAMAQFAHGVGLALDFMSSRGTSNNEIAKTLECILHEIRAIRRSETE